MAVGVRRFEVSPWPRRPLSPLPKEYATPLAVTSRLWKLPADTMVTTWRGVRDLGTVVGGGGAGMQGQAW